MMKRFHEISDIRFSGNILLITIDGEEKSFEIKKISTPLFEASDQERLYFEVSPSGYGIHWPLIDEDLSIDGLLGISHSPEQTYQSA